MKTTIRKISPELNRRYIRLLNLMTYNDARGSGSMNYVHMNINIEYGCAIYQEGKPIAWITVFHGGETHMFVHPKHRNKGYGHKLIQKAKLDYGNSKYCPWDFRSRQLFSKLNLETHPDYL